MDYNDLKQKCEHDIFVIIEAAKFSKKCNSNGYQHDMIESMFAISTVSKTLLEMLKAEMDLIQNRKKIASEEKLKK